MGSEKKAFELQHQVRLNAREYQNSVKDLYSWEKDIKSKEEALKNAPAPPVNNNAPVRSHVTKTAERATATTTTRKEEQSKGSCSPGTPTEKQDFPQNALAQQHKKANDTKDTGNNFVKQAEYEKAIEAYTEAIDIYPHDPVYFINRALCYIKLERYENCVLDCESAIALDKLCVKAYYRRMQANESLGNNMEALKDCTTVLAIEPKNKEAKSSLERINERLRKIATKHGPNFKPARDDLIDILPLDKPAYKRSKASMRRVTVVDIVSPRPNQDEPKQLRITDDEIDKIFNSNCGPFEEVKRVPKVAATQNVDVKIQEIKQAVAQSNNLDSNKKTSEKPVKTVPSQTIQSEEKALKAVPEQTVKLKDSDKIVEKPIEIAKTSSATKAQVKPATVSTMERVPPPAGTAQFYITWKELSPDQKYQYLKSIEIPNLCKILGAGFDSDTFADLLHTLQDYYVPNQEPTTAAVLLEISKNDEFNILAMLMSQEEKKMIAFIMDAIKEFPKSNPALLDKLAKVYNL